MKYIRRSKHYRYTEDKPIRLYKGKKRLAKFFLHKKRLDGLLWALSINIGDYIATCRGFNEKVERITYEYINEGAFRRCKKNKTWVLHDVEFYSKGGRVHYLDCVGPKEPAEYVKQYHKEVWGRDVNINEFGELCEDSTINGNSYIIDD